MSKDQFVSISIDAIRVGEPLPANLYVHLDHRFIVYRASKDVMDRNRFDRLQFKKIGHLFIREEDEKTFASWFSQNDEEGKATQTEIAPDLRKARDNAHRTMMDIFQTDHPDKVVRETVKASKGLVNAVMKQPYAIKSLNQLLTYSRGSVDHSVNVSVLSTYVAMQMGYTHNIILQHIGMGALLHDIGKAKVPIDDKDSPAQIEEKMQVHPMLGVKILEVDKEVPQEVLMIVAQHHECNDGTGYPNKLKGAAIYDLAQIVSIANVFDGLVGDSPGPLKMRQRAAVMNIDQIVYKQFNPQKLEKALRILRLGV